MSGFCTAGTASTGSISCVDAASTASTLSSKYSVVYLVPKYYQVLSVYSEYEEYVDHLGTAVSISSCTLFCRKHSPSKNTNRSWSKILTGVLAVLRIVCRALAGSRGAVQRMPVLGVLYYSYSQ